MPARSVGVAGTMREGQASARGGRKLATGRRHADRVERARVARLAAGDPLVRLVLEAMATREGDR